MLLLGLLLALLLFWGLHFLFPWVPPLPLPAGCARTPAVETPQPAVQPADPGPSEADLTALRAELEVLRQAAQKRAEACQPPAPPVVEEPKMETPAEPPKDLGDLLGDLTTIPKEEPKPEPKPEPKKEQPAPKKEEPKRNPPRKTPKKGDPMKLPDKDDKSMDFLDGCWNCRTGLSDTRGQTRSRSASASARTARGRSRSSTAGATPSPARRRLRCRTASCTSTRARLPAVPHGAASTACASTAPPARATPPCAMAGTRPTIRRGKPPSCGTEQKDSSARRPSIPGMASWLLPKRSAEKSDRCTPRKRATRRRRRKHLGRCFRGPQKRGGDGTTASFGRPTEKTLLTRTSAKRSLRRTGRRAAKGSGGCLSPVLRRALALSQGRRLPFREA